jgi:hypothetical protein
VYVFIMNPQAAMQSFLAGEIDQSSPDPDQWESYMADETFRSKHTAYKFVQPALSYRYIGWNMAKPQFKDKKTRQALTMLIDRDAIIKEVYQGAGQKAKNLIPPTLWSYNTKVEDFKYDRNLATARKQKRDADSEKAMHYLVNKLSEPSKTILETKQGPAGYVAARNNYDVFRVWQLIEETHLGSHSRRAQQVNFINFITMTQGAMSHEAFLAAVAKPVGGVGAGAQQCLVTGAGGTIVSTTATLASKTVTLGVADAADSVWSAVTAGAACPYVIVKKHTGTAATSNLIVYIDTATGLPVTPNGGDINLVFDNGANKIFKL